MRKLFLIISLFAALFSSGQSPLKKLIKTASIYDIDALSYITRVQAAGRSLSTAEKGYINTLFLGLKSDGLYTIIYDAGLPIWGSAAPSLITLKGVSTSTAVASPTFGSTGVSFNGTTQYINTGMAPNVVISSLSSSHLSYYSQTNVTEDKNDIGSSSGTNRFQMYVLATTGGQIIRSYTSTSQVASARGGTAAGFAIGSRTSSTDLRAFWNGTQTGSTYTTSVGGARPTQAIYVGAENDDGVAVFFSTKTCSFWSVGAGLNTTQAANFTTRIETFMDAMGIGQIP